MWPAVSRSAWARSFSANGQRRMRIAAVRRRASASVSPTCASSGSVKVTRGMMSRSRLRRQPEQHRADDESGMVAADMGELRAAGHDVADRVDAAVGRAQLGVDTWMPLAVMGDAAPASRSEPVDVGARGRRQRADACRRSRRSPSARLDDAPRCRPCRAAPRCATLVCSRIVDAVGAQAVAATIAASSGSSLAERRRRLDTVTSRAQPAIAPAPARSRSGRRR